MYVRKHGTAGEEMGVEKTGNKRGEGKEKLVSKIEVLLTGNMTRSWALL